MRAAIVFGLSLGIGLAASLAPAQEAGQTDQGIAAKIIGTYKLVAGNNGGKEIPKEQLNGRITIAKDVMTTYDADNKEVYVVRYNVEREAEPARIGMAVTFVPSGCGGHEGTWAGQGRGGQIDADLRLQERGVPERFRAEGGLPESARHGTDRRSAVTLPPSGRDGPPSSTVGPLLPLRPRPPPLLSPASRGPSPSWRPRPVHDDGDAHQGDEAADHVGTVGPDPVHPPAPPEREGDEDAAIGRVDPPE